VKMVWRDLRYGLRLLMKAPEFQNLRLSCVLGGSSAASGSSDGR